MGDPNSIASLKDVMIEENLIYEEVPVEILNGHMKRLTNKGWSDSLRTSCMQKRYATVPICIFNLTEMSKILIKSSQQKVDPMLSNILSQSPQGGLNETERLETCTKGHFRPNLTFES